MAEITNPNFIIYRDGRRRALAGALIRELQTSLTRLLSSWSEDALLACLLRSGELECALADVDSADGILAARAADQLATLACEHDGGVQFANAEPVRDVLRDLSAIRYHGELTVSRPEGFAYYALHPLDFADLITKSEPDTPYAVVIGIRSIGTTLSAVAAAQLRRMGTAAERTTVRPFGHPYKRQVAFNGPQKGMIRHALRRDGRFVVCDEGPGRSGSSFLSVAEALEREGVPCGSIMLLCSHEPDIEALCAYDAPRRWRRYRAVASGLSKRIPADADVYIGGGEWRRVLPFGGTSLAAWPQMERVKYLLRDQGVILGFEGHGHYGEAVRQRNELLADNGFGAPYYGQEWGFGRHELIPGSLVSHETLTPSLLTHLARYCAQRANAVFTDVTTSEARQLEAMAIANLEHEFGWAPDLRLAIERPAVCDGRMQPEEWRSLPDGQLLKLDAATHGDNHFFPGPTDIAWDLAAVFVEWNLDSRMRAFLLSEYTRDSGDHVEVRVAAYELAYTAFRMGWARMGAASTQGSEDEHRLMQDYRWYRSLAERLLQSSASLQVRFARPEWPESESFQL